MDYTEEYSKLEMECEPRKSFQRGLLYRRQTGIFVLMGTVCMIIFMVLTSVIYSHQERKFSMLESWMKSHTSDLTSVKSDFQNTGGDLEKKVAELQNLVFSLSSYLNTSGSSNPETREMQIKKLSNIETLMSDLGSSLSSLASKQEENLQKLERQQETSHTEVKSLMDGLSSAVSTLRSKLTEDSQRTSIVSLQPFLQTLRILMGMSSSLSDLKHSVELMRSSLQTLSYKLSFTHLLKSGCTEPDWIPFRNSCYLFSQDVMNWTNAKDYCEEKGALLLKIEDGSEKEWQFVSNFAKPHDYWIGLTDQNTGQWRWTDDTPYIMNKEHWRTGQPDEWTEHGLGEGGEDCGQIAYDGMLNDAHCSTKMKYICEMQN
ncbi:asialoglycoprotein receptor 1-like isoform X2 [Carassius carassius]|uniref:asialoglycoprotein receptor 1-like isoform X2 n=1 Tax=Carassius carassius TaxID=217509 RepID=UPI00286881FC|nr:asialoglycoprotein receptor 1-like isoform X2 [Carassius carassius]XP_059404848.1 asialoglycoprotein receptor 1-like isoform X2 [Carassius carassius]